MPLNRERLLKTFTKLCETPSPSGCEEKVIVIVEKYLDELNIPYQQDLAGNITSKIEGTGEPLLICAHLDTVPIHNTIKVIIRNNKITSSGESALGVDNKAPLAAILEFLTVAKESGLTLRPLELVFTVQEELGSKGASALVFSRLRSKRGIIFDREGPFGIITSAAPFYYTIDIEILGKSAHAGLEPEKGVNTIAIAAPAVSKIKQGSITADTKVNVGKITGGESRNTVPSKALIQAEVRSLDDQKAKKEVSKIVSAFRETSKNCGGRVTFKILNPCAGFKIKEDKFVKRIKHQIRELGFAPKFSPTCSGSDANIFNHRRIKTLNLSYGAHGTHTAGEKIALKDLENIVKLLLGVLVVE